MDKEREAFDEWYGVKPKGWFEAVRYNTAWKAWQAAKAQAQAVPETKKFNIDEFLIMEQKLKSKGGIIKADLDRFIAYAEIVLERAKATREPK